jgi:two-component sensor histidine kinase
MEENRKLGRWRTIALKLAVLWFFWLLLATIFAAQFYWIGRDLPLKISWHESFLRALLEWCPWMILSPFVVWLAERCRFDRGRRFWGVLPHLPACLLVVLANQGISMFLTQRSGGVVFFNFQNSAGSPGFGSGSVVQVIGSQPNVPLGAHQPLGLFLRSTNVGHDVSAAGKGGLSAGGENFSVTVMEPPRDASATGAIHIASGAAPFPGELPTPLVPPMRAPWTRFFLLTVTGAQSTIAIYWAIVCVTWVVSYYQQLRERQRRTLELEARLMQSNLQTLKAQLQPHFLFNTLNAIASLVRRKPDAAEEMIGSLSDFLRTTLDTAQQHEVPLRREIEFLDLYLGIQQARFGERLRILKEIDPAALDMTVPALILQPLVENSVRHGIEPRETGGTILIRALRHENSLRLDVRDDGEGLRAGQLAALREGVGLSNTKARLQELYGDAHRFHIKLNADGGLTVAVELPWRLASAKGASVSVSSSSPSFTSLAGLKGTL